MIRYVVALLVFGFVSGQRHNFTYKDCGSKATILSAQLEPCDSDPCVIKRGSDIKVYLTVLSDQDSKTAVLDAKMKVLGWYIPIPGLKSDLCSYVLKCPITKGETFTGVLDLSVPSILPFTKSSVKFQIRGDKGVSVCAETVFVIA
ncbi:mite group 2 allergen-like Ixo r 2 [Haemaphysalis longicornis]